MSNINLTTVKIFGEKYALDTFLVLFFGPLMAGGVIEAWRFCRTVALSIPVIAVVLWHYLQEMVPFNYLDMQKAV